MNRYDSFQPFQLYALFQSVRRLALRQFSSYARASRQLLKAPNTHILMKENIALRESVV
jgi:hypothetical protein